MHKPSLKFQKYFVAFPVDFAHLKRYSSKHQKDAAGHGRKELIMMQNCFDNASIQMSFLFTMAREMFAGLYYRTQKEKLFV